MGFKTKVFYRVESLYREENEIKEERKSALERGTMNNLITQIIGAITGSFTELGQAVINLLKNGFVWLFCEYTESSGVYTITGVSAFGYFVFILMGISLCLGLVYFLVNMVRRSK